MQLTRLGVIVLFALIVIASAITFPAIQAGREATRQRECTSHVKELVIALQNYHDTFLYLPYGARNRWRPDKAGEPEVTWGPSWMPVTKQLSMYQIHTSLYDRLVVSDISSAKNDHVSAPVRQVAHQVKIHFMLCPSSPLPQFQRLSGFELMVPSYAGITGAAPFESVELAKGTDNVVVREAAAPFDGVAAGNGMLLINECLTMAACTDGTANSIIVGEVSAWYYSDQGQRRNPALSVGDAGDGANDAAGWLAGTNLGFPEREPARQQFTWQGQYVHSLEPPIPANRVCNLMTIRHAVGADNRLGSKDTAPDWGTQGIGRCGLNNPLLSAHPTGAMVGFLDGHVVLVSKQTSLEVLQKLAIRDNGGAILSGFPSDD